MGEKLGAHPANPLEMRRSLQPGDQGLHPLDAEVRPQQIHEIGTWPGLTRCGFLSRCAHTLAGDRLCTTKSQAGRAQFVSLDHCPFPVHNAEPFPSRLERAASVAAGAIWTLFHETVCRESPP